MLSRPDIPLNPDQVEILNILIKSNQEHLFSGWETQNKEQIYSILDQFHDFHKSYPGGITRYIQKSVELIQQSQTGSNPFEGFSPYVPDRVSLTEISENYRQMEQLGAEKLGKTAIVLVAGGLGERLGYSDIKISIPVESITLTTYIEIYADMIQSMEQNAGRGTVPFIIMTSEDTHEKTVKLLEENNHFGLNKDQIFLLKQGLVPAIADPSGKIALEKPLSPIMKPHGHGDIHLLIYNSGLLDKLQKIGIEYLFFIQDTNAQVYNCLAAALGVSVSRNFVFNTLAVNRFPKEEVGAICRLKNGEKEFTVNVEYNQLDPLLRAAGYKEGDAPDQDGNSPYPGNTNLLLIQLTPYAKVLKKTKGLVPEFINPKYKDDSRTEFLKPARLETMMQDLPKLFTENQATGVTVFDRRWSFSANKNNRQTACKKINAGTPPEFAGSAEADLYHSGVIKLKAASADCSSEKTELKNGIINGPSVYLSPSFGLTLEDVERKTANITLQRNSKLIAKGKNIKIRGLTMLEQSALVINLKADMSLEIEDAEIQNHGFTWEIIDEETEQTVEEYLKLRGYRSTEINALYIAPSEPGHYYLGNDLILKHVSNKSKEF